MVEPTTTAAEEDHTCGYCGAFGHAGVCPRVRMMEYHPDGSLKRVMFWDQRPPPTPASQGTGRPGDPIKVDCEPPDAPYSGAVNAAGWAAPAPALVGGERLRGEMIPAGYQLGSTSTAGWTTDMMQAVATVSVLAR